MHIGAMLGRGDSSNGNRGGGKVKVHSLALVPSCQHTTRQQGVSQRPHITSRVLPKDPLRLTPGKRPRSFCGSRARYALHLDASGR
jgi:hypothetical protein